MLVGVLAGLAAAIDEVEIPAEGDGLAEAVGLLDRLAAKVVTAVGAFDAAGGWEVEGATSMTAWLRHRGGMTGGQAAAMVRTAGVLRRLPGVAEGWRSGRLSGGQVRAVVANVRPATVGLLADHEASVVAAVAPLSVADTAVALQHWARHADALADDGGDMGGPERALHVSATLAGRVEMAGSLDPEAGSVVATAVPVATTRDVDGEPARTPARRRADALVEVCRFFLDHQTTARGGRRRPHLNVIVDLDHLQTGGGGGGRLVDGLYLDAPTVDRLLCDSALHRVVTAGRSAVLDYGTTVRTVPAPLWAAVVVRDRHCRFPGCDRPPAWCEAHHVIPLDVIPLAAGGPTSLDNLVLVCTRHHHLCHTRGWQAKLRPDATLHLTTPTGRVLTSRPPPHDPIPPPHRSPPRGNRAARRYHDGPHDDRRDRAPPATADSARAATTTSGPGGPGEGAPRRSDG